MRVEILNKTNGEIQLLMEGIKPSFASALRRIMISEIPTMAIEWVDFKKNESALNDEIIANRLGQIPLAFDRKAYNLIDECDKCSGKGCSNCQVKLTLKKKGPRMIYSGDLKSTDKSVKPAFDKIPVVELFDDQELQFEATAQLGLGKVHAKWQGAVVGYKNKPVKEVSRKEESEETKYQENAFIFNVESVSGLSAEDVVLTATEILENKLKEFNKSLGKLK